MNKLDYKAILKNRWYLFLIIPLVVFIAWILLGKTLASPKVDQRLEILISTEKVSAVEFKTKMESLKDDHIYKINLTCYNSESDIFPKYYQAAAASQDFMIISSNFLNADTLPNLFTDYCKIDTEYLEESLGIHGLSYLRKRDDCYGFTIYDKETKLGYFKEYIGYNENYNYYLTFGRNSHHVGKMNNCYSQAALNLLKKLMAN